MLAGLDSAPRARDAFIKSVELDPKDFQSRWDLNRFYLEAPGVVGGSVQAAIANSEDHRKLNVSQGLLLRAQTHIHQREFDKAEAVLASAVPAGDDLVQRKLAELWTSLGFAMFKDSKAELARGVFERRVAVEEGNAQFHYLLARAHLRLNSLNPAIASLERALRIKADDVDSYFALAFAQEAKGDMPKAIAAFEKILELSPTGNFSAAAKARLEALRK